MLSWMFLLFLQLSPNARGADIDLCPRVKIKSPEELEFTTTEKRWVCGDSNNEAWEIIPLWQKQFYLKNFLQDRGFHNVAFSTVESVLVVETGPRSHLKSWKVSVEYPGFKSQKRRGWVGRNLTPDLLNEMESWSQSRLGEIGYPCAKVKATATPATDEVHLDIAAGPLFHFPSPDSVDLPDPEVLSSIDRYAAFSQGRLFDERLLQLSASRMVRDEYILSSFFEVTCQEELKIRPRLMSGDPQILAAGAGFNTEVGAIAQVRYKHTHLDTSGSSFESLLFVSQREQSFKNSFTIYQGPPYESRYFLRPKLNFKNELEPQYEALTMEFGTLAGMTYEFSNARLELSGGPSYVYNETRRPDKDILRTVTFETLSIVQNHDHEYYMSQPFTGWTFSLSTFSGFKNLGASQDFHQLNFSGQNLWNLGDWTPPMAILGLRFRTGTFILEDVDNFASDIPETYRFFLGGDSTLRGFGRKQIGGAENGAISYFYSGIELREGDVFWGKIQPFIFVDLGWVGEQTFTVRSDTYWSPGVGLRWATFLGPIRGSISRGFVDSDSDPLGNNWVYYLSLGSEF